MTIALCDDELPELEYLRRLVVSYYNGNKQFSPTISCYQSGDDLLLSMEKGQRFDVIFLDVFLGASNGVAIARKIRELDKRCSIIFATNSREHAIEGYAVRALQYLVKPVSPLALSEALDQALENSMAKPPRFVHIKTRQNMFSVLLSDIVFAESDARVITLYRGDQGKINFYEKLDNFEMQCNDKRFLRCHKSFLVNMEHVRLIANNTIIIKSGEEIPISINITRAKELFASYMASML